MPKISVIVPVYKVESYLSRCIDSIISQTFIDFELILVDDGSPDSCGVICDDYAEKDDRIIVIHKVNGGLSDARNVGIDWAFANSDSEWVTFIDSDDWIHPRYLELLFNAVISTGISVALVNFERSTGETPEVLNDKLSLKIKKTKDLYSDSYVQFITAWGKLYRKDDFLGIRYPKGKLHEDEFTTWRILFRYPSLAVIDAPLYVYYINKDGITQANWNLHRSDGLEAQKERLAAIERNFALAEYREKTAQITAYTIAGYIQILEKEDVLEKKKLISDYKKELRAFLRKYKKEVPFRGYGWAYEKAYPHLTPFFVLSTDIMDRIQAKLHKI